MPANLYRRGATWYARIQVNGRDDRSSLRTADRKEAGVRLKALLKAAEDERAGLTPAPGEGKTWQDAAVRWATVHFDGLRERAQRRYRTSLAVLDPFLRDRPLPSIRRADLAAFVAVRRAAGISAATVKRDLDVVAMVIEAAIDAEWLPDDHPNPAHRPRRALVERREAIQPVPMRHLGFVLRLAPPGFAALLRFLARTGCREEEGADVELPELNLAAGTVTFPKTKTRSPRVAQLTPQEVRDLRRWLPVRAAILAERARQQRHLPKAKRTPPSLHLFLSSRGERFQSVPSQFRALMARAVALAGTDAWRHRSPLGRPPRRFRCHDLRHTYGIRFLQKRCGTKDDLQHQMGHASVQTTEGYVRWLALTRADPGTNPGTGTPGASRARGRKALPSNGAG